MYRTYFFALMLFAMSCTNSTSKVGEDQQSSQQIEYVMNDSLSTDFYTDMKSYVPAEGFIPTADIAVKIAECVLLEIYGKESIEKGLCQVESTNISSYLSLVLCTHITNKRLIPNIRIILFQQFLGYFPSTIFRSFCISCSFSNFILSINSTNFSHGYSISYIFIRHNTFIYIRRML